MIEKIKKNANYLFLNIETESQPKWARVGKSTEWTDTMNAKTTTYEYIEDEGSTDVIESYQPSTSVPLTAYLGDPIYNYIFGLYRDQDVGIAANTQALRVFQNKDTNGKNLAQLSDCTIIIDNFNFATGVVTFIIKQSGSPTAGYAEVQTTIDTEGNKTHLPIFTVA